MQLDQLRQLFLDYCVNNGHKILPSASLVPDNDPTTLFTGSGMQPLLVYLLGQPHPLGQRVANSQKCFRSQDIEEIGDNRHTTFFEMLGNWSFGDYFKQEQLTWFFSFLVNQLSLDPQRLFVSVYGGDPSLKIDQDNVAIEIWQKIFAQHDVSALVVDQPHKGLQDGRIFLYRDKNWWSRAGAPSAMPAGEPGGPSSEVFFDFGAQRLLHENSIWRDQPCHINCDCGRFLEIGNSVFMQYRKTESGQFELLPQANIDFGGGLERLIAANQDQLDIFQTPVFANILAAIESATQLQYPRAEQLNPEQQQHQRAFRVVADHVKAAVMLAADGVYPGNKSREYFVRRLLRRALRYGRFINLTNPNDFALIVQAVAVTYQSVYPEVMAQAEAIAERFVAEATQFSRNLEKGLQLLQALPTITEAQAFTLYETHGFPFELTQELAAERGIELDTKVFDQLREQARTTSRTQSAGVFKAGLAESGERTTKLHTATHLLQAALRQVLGTSVHQMGSHITSERLRFDFSHPSAMTPTQIQATEKLINDWISQDLPVSHEQLPKDQALAQGAMAFFREKYPDTVTVYTIGRDAEHWVSKELCGGPHVTHTQEIGQIKITKEKSVAAGTRRIYLEFA